MTAKSTKKKTAKKQAKVGTTKGFQQARLGGPAVGGVLASVHQPTPLPEALAAFDVALEKVKGLRGIILPSLTDEVAANRARRLADAASALQTAGWNLRESACHEADK